MQENRITAKILHTYFGSDLDLRVQIYNLLALVGIMAGIGIATIAVLLKDSLITILIHVSVAILSYIMLRVAEKKKRYHLCSWVFVIIVFLFLFPVLFFSCGGHKSGVDFSFLIAFVFTAVLLEKYERIAAIIIEFILYVFLLVIVYFKPELLVVLPAESNYIVVTLVNFTIACVMILIVVMMRAQMFNSRHEQIKELNRELTARNETLARYDHMKSDFLATVAHEINTPLAVIAASSNDTLDLLKESPLNMEEIVENQVIIERRIKLIDSILLDLMDTVAIENGRLSLFRQPVQLSDLIKNTCDIHFKRLDVKNNRITYDIQPGLPKVWADTQRIEQVMINLLSNACMHTEGGDIAVRLTHSKGTQIVVVKDNGEGMDAEVAQTVLKQYVSTKTDYWRHGIGLSICRRIIVAHGGEIWVDSEKGQGTSISFWLREEAEYE